MQRVAGPIGMLGLAIAVVGLVAGWWIMRQQEEKYEREFLQTTGETFNRDNAKD